MGFHEGLVKKGRRGKGAEQAEPRLAAVDWLRVTSEFTAFVQVPHSSGDALQSWVADPTVSRLRARHCPLLLPYTQLTRL